MKTIKHCKRQTCLRYLSLTENDFKTKPLKCIELIKIFKNEKYKVNSLESHVYISKNNNDDLWITDYKEKENVN